MPPKRKQQSKPVEEHSHIAIRVEHYEAEVRARVNYYAYEPQYAYNLDDDDPVYEFTNQVAITGLSVYPSERQGDRYELTIYGTDSPSHRLNEKLKDIQARDDKYSLQYRTYRGKQIPIYVAPNGLGRLEKVRGEKLWKAWLFVTSRFVNDLLVLLGRQRTLFVSLHERKIDRDRWVQGMSVQTTDPSEE